MAYQYVSAEAWDEFEKRWPNAAAFLTNHDGKGEEKALKSEAQRIDAAVAARGFMMEHEQMRREWIIQRLANFELAATIFGDRFPQQRRVA